MKQKVIETNNDKPFETKQSSYPKRQTNRFSNMVYENAFVV